MASPARRGETPTPTDAEAVHRPRDVAKATKRTAGCARMRSYRTGICAEMKSDARPTAATARFAREVASP